MSFLYPLLIVVHVLLCLFLILLVLIQNDKGGGLAGALGGMGGGAFTGSTAATFITKLTQGVALVSFLIILILNGMSTRRSVSSAGSELSNDRNSGLSSIIPEGFSGNENTTVVPGLQQQSTPAAANPEGAASQGGTGEGTFTPVQQE